MWELHARHCPLCAGALGSKRVEERERAVCVSCGLTLYVNPAAAAAALVVRDSEVLLIRRRSAPYQGHWTLPAGYEEYDEPPYLTAERETREETGLEVRAVGLVDILYTRDDPRKRGVLAVYLCEVLGGAICPGDDASEAAFFPIDRVPERIGFVNNRRILDRVKKELAEGGIRSLPVSREAEAGA